MSRVARSVTIAVRAVSSKAPARRVRWTGCGMTESAVSWTPATSATHARRVIMARMISLAEMFSDPYFTGHETTRLHPDDGRGSRRWRPCPLIMEPGEEAGSHRARDLRRPARDGGKSGAHPRSGAGHRLQRRRAAVVVQSLRSHARAGGRDAQERRTARPVVSHVGRHDLRRMGAQPRDREGARSRVPGRARLRGLDQANP